MFENLDGTSAGIQSMREFVNCLKIHRGAMQCIEYVALHGHWHLKLLKENIIAALLLSTSAHQEDKILMISSSMIIVYFLRSCAPLPCNNSFQLSPIAETAKIPKKSPKKARRNRRRNSMNVYIYIHPVFLLL